ncbi:Serine/threonine-protein kinase STE11 [Pseudocercospora fuligena]|uniref:mitogen-activated protein kinase kinase kinase n=1 Tax=Pseudocercospora fuligena TaxID=685502 RepID=A0A8H6RU37_9PEZI|nr:Serine/threonine-protein kinase STE11 [Pseudocercospora fuligena]
MAALASRSPYPAPSLASTMAPTSTAPHYRPLAPPAPHGVNGHGVFTSPTESEFSESYKEAKESILDWDESRVGDWLKSINCAQYVEIFRKNNITGENLMDLDQATLKEMGIKKIGDRVRINTHAKVFRSNVYKRTSKRVMNRHSLATLDGNQQLTPPSSGSPRPLHSARSGTTSRADKRISRQLNGADLAYAAQIGKSSSRPSSPMVDQENRTRRHGAPSPMEGVRKESSNTYASQNPPLTARFTGNARTPLDTPQTARFQQHVRAQPSLDNLNSNASSLPAGKPLIRVIFENGNASVINIDGFRTAEDIIRKTLRKGALNENHFRSYCFYVLDGTDPNPNFCRRLGEAELCKLCQDAVRTERGRLILRKIHAGEPDGEQLKTAAQIAEQQQPEPPAIEVQTPYKTKSQLKIEKLTGEPSLAAVSYPMSPATQAERNDYFATQNSGNISRHVSAASTASARARKLKDFYGARPPTELITQDLQSYFPEVGKEEMDRTVRMSIRRSRRLSRAVRTLSMASNFSVASSLKDAPPLPTIADTWLKEAGQAQKAGLRPLSVVRLGRSDSHRESVTSSVLEPLDEESPLEPNRKSYVSFGGDSGSDTTTSNLAVTDPEGNTVTSYFDDTGSSPGGTEGGSESLNSRLSRFIAEDGEESDDELIAHLESNSWDDLKYLKGAMIGQGSFGTVFLALHAVTAELMAVKQVEMPTNSGTAMDAKKNNMIEALKHEISLLRDLKHDNIVRYLGSNSDEKNLNIFLEYVAGGSVATMLVNYGSLPEGLVSNFVRQILQGLNYLHSKDIIHRDIKGANILVDNKGTVKISDFGISKRVEASTLLNPLPHKRGGPRVSLQGSVFWMAPEVVRQTAYTKKADIWSLGCLVVEMMTGSHPHPNCTQLQAIFKIGGSGASPDNAKPDLPESASEHAKEFLKRTFELEHEKRPSAEELMEMEFTKVKG